MRETDLSLKTKGYHRSQRKDAWPGLQGMSSQKEVMPTQSCRACIGVNQVGRKNRQKVHSMKAWQVLDLGGLLFWHHGEVSGGEKRPKADFKK